MPPVTFVRFVLSLVSLAILAGSAYLLWSWAEGEVLRTESGEVLRIREDWRLWTGLALALWSLFGRLLLTPFLGRAEQDPPRYKRAQGRAIPGANGASLYVEEHGSSDSPVLIFTHGQALDATIWAYARRDLAKDYRLVFWDLPGLGLSRNARREDHLTVPAAAEQLARIMDACGGQRAILIGHSFGGMAIQELAQSDKEFSRRVAGVILLNTTLANPLRTMILGRLALALQKPVLEPMSRLTALIEPIAWLSNWQSYFSGFAHLANRIQFNGAVTRQQLEHTSLLSTRNSPRAIELRNIGMFRWSGLKATSFGVPVLIIGGAKDIVTKPGASERLALEVQGAQLMIVPDANHMGPVEHSAVYNSAIRRFAQECLAREEAAARSDLPKRSPV